MVDNDSMTVYSKKNIVLQETSLLNNSVLPAQHITRGTVITHTFYTIGYNFMWIYNGNFIVIKVEYIYNGHKLLLTSLTLQNTRLIRLPIRSNIEKLVVK